MLERPPSGDTTEDTQSASWTIPQRERSAWFKCTKTGSVQDVIDFLETTYGPPDFSSRTARNTFFEYHTQFSEMAEAKGAKEPIHYPSQKYENANTGLMLWKKRKDQRHLLLDYATSYKSITKSSAARIFHGYWLWTVSGKDFLSAYSPVKLEKVDTLSDSNFQSSKKSSLNTCKH